MTMAVPVARPVRPSSITFSDGGLGQITTILREFRPCFLAACFLMWLSLLFVFWQYSACLSFCCRQARSLLVKTKACDEQFGNQLT